MSHQNPVGRALDVLVFAPLGVGVSAVEAAPAFLDACAQRGRDAVAQGHEQLNARVANARGMGKFAIAYGLPKLRTRAERLLRDRRPGAASRTAPAPTPTSAPEPAPVLPIRVTRPAPVVAAANGGATPDPEDLPIPGYDALSASQVVERLAGLPVAELDAVRAYESSHRHRRTILGKIEQLASPAT